MESFVIPLENESGIYVDLVNLLTVYNLLKDDDIKKLYLPIIKKEIEIVKKLQADICAKIEREGLKRVK